ncbi:MAG: GNAT family N-acetyltransferase [Gordonia sp. (in: high G+C Gram-positive bacteria)]
MTTADTNYSEYVLENPALASLRGPHAHFAERRGNVLRYPADVSPFVALPDPPDDNDWADAAALLGPGAIMPLATVSVEPPPGWEVVIRGAGVQLVDRGVVTAAEPEAVVLGAADVPEMLDLIGLTKPGPFLPRTITLGTYLGIRRDGQLVAMAGERLHPPGWTEISAVCTHPDYRGNGYASRLVRAVAHGIRARGETPFMHASATNVNAIRLYESIGFAIRRQVSFEAVRVPENSPEKST